jgi:hypothetical protein
MQKIKHTLRDERGDIAFFACFFILGAVMLISFLLLYASVQINCINIRKEILTAAGAVWATVYRTAIGTAETKASA